MHPFNPEPVIPESQKFDNKMPNDNNINKNNDIISNNQNNINLSNFTEKIETKIVGKSQNSIKENKDKINTINAHDDNMISLGIIPNKDNILKDNKYEQRNEINDNDKKDDEEKDNTTEDEDEILKKLRITESVEDDYNINKKEINEKELSKEKRGKNEETNNNKSVKYIYMNNKKMIIK